MSADNNDTQREGTFVKTIKNMINDFMDSKKTDFNKDAGSSSPGDEQDGKVGMSDTDEDGSQISPIQTFKVNQNRK